MAVGDVGVVAGRVAVVGAAGVLAERIAVDGGVDETDVGADGVDGLSKVVAGGPPVGTFPGAVVARDVVTV